MTHTSGTWQWTAVKRSVGTGNKGDVQVGCCLCKKMGWLHITGFEKHWWAGRETMGVKIFCGLGCLRQATVLFKFPQWVENKVFKPTKETLWLILMTGHQPRRACRWSILTSATGSIKLPVSDPARRLQLPWHLPEKQHSCCKLKVVCLGDLECSCLIQVITSPLNFRKAIWNFLRNCWMNSLSNCCQSSWTGLGAP